MPRRPGVYHDLAMDTPAAVRFTYADYRNLPEESRYEILDGDLQMSPSPTTIHQRVVRRLFALLVSHVELAGSGEVFVAPLDVVLSDTDVVQPDIFFVSGGRASIVREKAVFGAPDLVLEVLSPATAERDRSVKAKVYARAGVRELWLLDPDKRTIQVFENGPRGFAARSNPGGKAESSVLAGFAVSAEKIFGTR